MKDIYQLPIQLNVFMALMVFACLILELVSFLIGLKRYYKNKGNSGTKKLFPLVLSFILWIASIIVPLLLIFSLPGNRYYDAKRWIVYSASYIAALGLPVFCYRQFGLIRFGGLSASLKFLFITMFLFQVTGCGGVFDKYLPLFE